MQGATTTITEANTTSVTYCYAIGFGAPWPARVCADSARMLH